MSEPIKVGDLVMVVRRAGYCGCFLGVITRVEKIEPSPNGHITCSNCGTKLPTFMDALREGGGWTPLPMLKRIPPLSELEGEKNKEELTA